MSQIANRVCCVAGPLLMLVICGSVASAAPVTVQFSGTVEQFNDQYGVTGGSVTLGTPFFGTYAIDPTIVVGKPNYPAFGVGTNFGTAYVLESIEFSVGSLEISGEFGALVMFDDIVLNDSEPADFVRIAGTNSLSSPVNEPVEFGLIFPRSLWRGA